MPISDQAVVVSKTSFDSDESYDIVHSNISFLNALIEEHFNYDELSQNALRSYYVDYYLAQLNNGGFSQFVYNSGWEPYAIQYVRDGLQAVGAHRHYELFNESAEILDRIGPEGMEKFFESEYFGDNKERDVLNEFDDKFFELSEEEDLVEFNSAWLHSLPDLVVLTIEEMHAEVERRAEALPDREEREAQALEEEPRFMKLIRALCDVVDHELSHITAGDPTHEHNGEPTVAWHFITDKGHHYMLDVDGMAFMFNGDSDEKVAEIEATEEYGSD